MSIDQLSVMDGGKCIVQVRGVRPFLSDKYDITQHPNYRLTADYDRKNWFNVEKFLTQFEEMKYRQEGEDTVGGRIRMLRKKKDYTQEQLAWELHMENKASISSYESNRRGVSGQLAVEMAEVLETSTDYILRGISEDNEHVQEAKMIIERMDSSHAQRLAVQHLRLASEIYGHGKNRAEKHEYEH